VLVAAHRQELANHAACKNFLADLASGTDPWGLPVFCLGEFLRVVTHNRVFDPPTSIDQALQALEGLLASPSVRLLAPGARYAPNLMAAVRDAKAKGNLVFDAQIAAVCREHGALDLATFDRDFDRFRAIRAFAPAG
jgi:toxin-antitoxin system PIN domain toxin